MTWATEFFAGTTVIVTGGTSGIGAGIAAAFAEAGAIVHATGATQAEVDTAIAAGSLYTCARTTADAALCWGGNGNGQLGDGSTDDRTTPVPVSGLGSGVAAIAVGGTHSCALTTAGAHGVQVHACIGAACDLG